MRRGVTYIGGGVCVLLARPHVTHTHDRSHLNVLRDILISLCLRGKAIRRVGRVLCCDDVGKSESAKECVCIALVG